MMCFKGIQAKMVILTWELQDFIRVGKLGAMSLMEASCCELLASQLV